MCDDILGWGFNTKEYKLTVKLAEKLREKYGEDFEILLFTALWLSEDPDDKAIAMMIKDKIQHFIGEKKTEGLVRLCRSILVDVLEHFIPWLEKIHESKVKFIEIESYYASYKDMTIRFYMVSEEGEEERVAYYPCSEPDGVPYLLILCELQPSCTIVCTESYDFSVKGINVSFIALV